MIMKIEEKRNSLLKEFKKSLRELRLIQQIDLLQENLNKIQALNMNSAMKEKSTQRHVTKRTKALLKRDTKKKEELNDCNKNVMKWLDTLQDDTDFREKDRTETETFQVETNKKTVKSKTPESLNIDSLLSSYKKFENEDVPLPPLIVFSDEEEDDVEHVSVSDAEDVNNNLDKKDFQTEDLEIDKKVSKIREILKGNTEGDAAAAQETQIAEGESEAPKGSIVPLMMVISKHCPQCSNNMFSHSVVSMVRTRKVLRKKQVKFQQENRRKEISPSPTSGMRRWTIRRTKRIKATPTSGGNINKARMSFSCERLVF